MKKPPEGSIKCNVGGSFVNLATPSKAGWVKRDNHGLYRGACQGVGRSVKNALESEFQAYMEPRFQKNHNRRRQQEGDGYNEQSDSTF